MKSLNLSHKTCAIIPYNEEPIITAISPYLINSRNSALENLFSSPLKPINFILIYDAIAVTYSTWDYWNVPGKRMDFKALSYTYWDFFFI